MEGILSPLPMTGLRGYETKGISVDMNTLTLYDYYDRLSSIALSLFEWHNLPDSCSERFMEITLFSMGRCVFVKDKFRGFMNLKVTPSTALNVYDEATKYVAYGNNYSEEFDIDKCVFIRNNYLEKPTDISLMLFAQRLANCERTIDVNINAQKTPIIIRCDEKDKVTLDNLYQQYAGNKPFIIGSKSLNLENLSVLKTDAPFVSDKINDMKKIIWNEAMTFLGVNNANTDKRERLITDEVNANNELININAQAMLLTRQQACEQINKMFDQNVSVTMRTFATKEGESEWQDTPQNLEQS